MAVAAHSSPGRPGVRLMQQVMQQQPVNAVIGTPFPGSPGMLGRGAEGGKISNHRLNFLDPSLKSIVAANMSSSSENPPSSTWGLSVGCLAFVVHGQVPSSSGGPTCKRIGHRRQGAPRLRICTLCAVYQIAKRCNPETTASWFSSRSPTRCSAATNS